jgi:hypothetical protein
MHPASYSASCAPCNASFCEINSQPVHRQRLQQRALVRARMAPLVLQQQLILMAVLKCHKLARLAFLFSLFACS